MHRSTFIVLLVLITTLSSISAQESQTVTRTFKHLGKSVLIQKTANPVAGESRVIATTLDGAPVDFAEFERQEAALAASASRIDPMLLERFQQAPNSVQDCCVWLRFDPSSLEFRSEMEQRVRAGMDVGAARKTLRESVVMANAPVIERGISLLQSLGLEVTYADPHAPILFFTGTHHQVAGLALSSLVDRVYPSLDYEAELNNAVATHRWDRVHEFGVRGDGVKVAIVESGAVTNVHPDLNVTAWFNSTAPLNISFHPTAIAGIIGSSNAANPGHARGIEILSGNSSGWSDANLIAATAWALGQGADIINMSFGVDTNLALAALDRYVDYTVRFTATCIVKSAGNRGNTDGDCTSPGLGWNVLTVGNVSDQNNSDWSDDVMRFDSSFGDPISANGDRTKPDLCAVGTSMVTTDMAGGFSNQGSGTSYAAPGIVGMAAALMQARPSLKTWPEEVRALMMVAAGHNIEGSSRLSTNDGAGCINGLRAYRIVESGNLLHGTLQASSFTATGYKTHDIYLRGGEKTRVVLCWDSQAAADFSTDTLEADLDLAILQGQGQTVGGTLASSSSFDNSYEIIEFIPQVTGWHTVRINDWRFDGSSEYYGLAWSQNGDGNSSRFRPFLPEHATGDGTGPVIGNASFWIDPIDSVHPNASFLCLPSLADTTGIPLGGGVLIHGDFDFLTNYAFSPGNTVFHNMMGSFDGAGTTYSTRLSMPDNPGLVGFPVIMNLLTLTPGGAFDDLGEPLVLEFESKTTDLGLGDDNSAVLPLPFAFPFYGSSYTQVYVNANGNLTFGGSSVSWTETLSKMETGFPRIAALWDDLSASDAGEIRYRLAPNHVVIEWNNVGIHSGNGAYLNSVMVFLYSDGSIEFKYRDCDVASTLVGISPGNSLGTTKQVNLDHGFVTGYAGGGICEVFDAANPLDLDIQSSYRNTVRFTPVGSAYRMTVNHR